MGSDQSDPKAPHISDSGHVDPEDDKNTFEVSKKQPDTTSMEESTTGNNDVIDEDNDGFKTPVNQGIPAMTECPPGPRKRMRYDDEELDDRPVESVKRCRDICDEINDFFDEFYRMVYASRGQKPSF